jgi:hypothetical protein
VKTLENEHKVEFTVAADTWNTLWLIQKVINESEKNKASVRIEIKSGSVETTVQLIAYGSTIANFLLAIIVYVRSKREQDKPLRVTRISRDAAYIYVENHLRTIADAPNARLISEKPNLDGSYFFGFKDAEGVEHTYVITNDFELKYSRKENRFFREII